MNVVREMLSPFDLAVAPGLDVAARDGGEARDLLARVVRIARSNTIGTEIAELTVCGAVAPCKHLAGGNSLPCSP